MALFLRTARRLALGSARLCSARLCSTIGRTNERTLAQRASGRANLSAAPAQLMMMTTTTTMTRRQRARPSRAPGESAPRQFRFIHFRAAPTSGPQIATRRRRPSCPLCSNQQPASQPVSAEPPASGARAAFEWPPTLRRKVDAWRRPKEPQRAAESAKEATTGTPCCALESMRARFGLAPPPPMNK